MRNQGISSIFRNSEAALQGPSIIIADKNQISRTRTARVLAGPGRSVEATGSAAKLMHSLLHDSWSVVVLGDGLEEELSPASLVALLKSCCPRATLILAAGELSLAEERKVRQQGIFYRASRPVSDAGWDELSLAVDCACRKLALAAKSACAFGNPSRV